jgi:Glycosyl transferase family 11
MIIARIKGGLGNQLFCYAAARRLALANNAELVIDHVTGFARDYEYRRQYALDHFHIPCRKATPKERMEPFSRYRRYMAKFITRRQPFQQRRYVEQEGNDFDERLLYLKPLGNIYLDGLWQSESYFKDVAQIIRDDLRIISPIDAMNHKIAEEICNSNAIALHVRWFDAPGSVLVNNISIDYYQNAIAFLEEKIDTPRYFLFSNAPEASLESLDLPKGRVTFVTHNRGDENAYANLWLMTLCKHFIIANSTFSWWGAWLSDSPSKVVIAPDLDRFEEQNHWRSLGLIPAQWQLI